MSWPCHGAYKLQYSLLKQSTLFMYILEMTCGHLSNIFLWNIKSLCVCIVVFLSTLPPLQDLYLIEFAFTRSHISPKTIFLLFLLAQEMRQY